MAQYNQAAKKKSSGPDEFISFFSHLAMYLRVHQTKFAAIVLAVVLCLAGYGVYLYYCNHQILKFATDYMKAEQAPSEESLKSWKDLEGLGLPSPLSELVDLQIGSRLAKKDDWKGAAGYFSKASGASQPIIEILGTLAYGVASENAGDLENAMQAYQKLASLKTEVFQGEGRLGMARVFLLQNDRGRAKEILLELARQNAEALSVVKVAAINGLLAMSLEEKK